MGSLARINDDYVLQHLECGWFTQNHYDARFQMSSELLHALLFEQTLIGIV